MNFTVVCKPLARRFGVPCGGVLDFLPYDDASQQLKVFLAILVIEDMLCWRNLYNSHGAQPWASYKTILGSPPLWVLRNKHRTTSENPTPIRWWCLHSNMSTTPRFRLLPRTCPASRNRCLSFSLSGRIGSSSSAWLMPWCLASPPRPSFSRKR
ncbi:hypothetical protein D3C71_1735520 [compost metagenome]